MSDRGFARELLHGPSCGCGCFTCGKDAYDLARAVERQSDRADKAEARVAELSEVLRDILDNVTIGLGGTDGRLSLRGVWCRGTADHAGIFDRARRALAGTDEGAG